MFEGFNNPILMIDPNGMEADNSKVDSGPREPTGYNLNEL